MTMMTQIKIAARIKKRQTFWLENESEKRFAEELAVKFGRNYRATQGGRGGYNFCFTTKKTK